MQEDFLHHTWKYRLFDQFDLFTTDGEIIEIIKPGEHNRDAGPDFFNAHLKIGGIHWVGNVELHIRSSDWMKHDHQSDPAYDNVILHVVYENDETIFRKNGEAIPALELKDRIDANSYERYLGLNKSKDVVACEKLISEVDDLVVNGWLDRLMAERLESRSALIMDRLQLNVNNWEETFYQILARNFGFKINNEPFELLARSLPLKIISKHKHDRLQLEALLYGQAGMLDKIFTDSYALQLKKECDHLKKKYSLDGMDAHLWKFSRMMPGNFPTIRISQLADLLQHSSHLFSQVMEVNDSYELRKLFSISASPYWMDHYVFDKPSSVKIKTMGEESISILIMNAIAPFLFIYGKSKGEERYMDKAFALLENMEGEKNTIISYWEKIGVKGGTAFRSQALLQLRNEYCNKKKCLNCAVGAKLLSH